MNTETETRGTRPREGVGSLQFEPARTSWVQRYAAAFGAIAVSLLVRAAFSPGLGYNRPYITLFAGVAFATWFGGWKAAAPAAAFGFLAAHYFFTGTGTLVAFNLFYLLELTAFTFSAGLIVLFGEAAERARRRHEMDAAERRVAEESERQQKELLRITLGSIGDGVIITDTQGRVQSLNAEAERLTGWTSDTAINQPLRRVFHIVKEETGLPADNPVDKVLQIGTPTGLTNHTVLISSSGTSVPIDDSAAPIREPGGPIFGVVLVFRDVSAQRTAQLAQARLAAIVEFSGDAIATKNLDGIIQTWNASAERLFGYRAEEIVGRPITTLIPPDRLNEETAILARLRAGKPSERFETIRLAKDGRQIPVAVSVSPIKDVDGRVVGASKIVNDVTEVVAARLALAEEKELLATTLASIGDGVITTDADGLVTSLNLVAESVTGWRRADAVGQPLDRVFLIINEETRQRVESPAVRALRDGMVVGLANQTLLIRRDGTECPVDDSAAPIRNGSGRVVGCVLVFRDITTRKLADNERRRLLESERAARADAERASLLKDEFLATLSHELRAPLNAILGWSRLIETNRNDPETLSRGLEVINRNATLQADLIADLLDMSRIDSGKLRLNVGDVDLAEVVNAGLDAIRHAADARGIDIRADVGAAPETIRGDARRLQQVVWNLLSNAVKFTPRGGRVTIALSRTNAHANIEVRDTGIGIRPEFLPHLFERFRQADASAARQHDGLGLGLAIVKHVVELHGGSVKVESPGEGLGAAFFVELPLLDGRTGYTPAGGIRNSAYDVRSVRGHEIDLRGVAVLVIDDQADARTLLTRILEERDGHVLVAHGVDAGLRAVEEHRPDIVLCDIGMPAKDGYTFITELRARGNRTPALAVTAFAQESDRSRVLLAGYQGHLTKPVEPSQLVAAIAALLGRSG